MSFSALLSSISNHFLILYLFWQPSWILGRHLENWVNFDWLTRKFQKVHDYEHICQVSYLYPEVQGLCHFQLH